MSNITKLTYNKHGRSRRFAILLLLFIFPVCIHFKAFSGSYNLSPKSATLIADAFPLSKTERQNGAILVDELLGGTDEKHHIPSYTNRNPEISSGDLNENDISEIKNARSINPHRILGLHRINYKGKASITVRIFLPNILKAYVLLKNGNEEEMEKVDESGFFELRIEKQEIISYQIKAIYHNGAERIFNDPYAFLPEVFTDMDFFLFGEGNHFNIYEKMGAHIIETDNIRGTYFALWAPSAKRVSIIGDFNNWDGRVHQMRATKGGIFELFIPGIETNVKYKYEIKGSNEVNIVKSDPYAFFSENRPDTASKTFNLNEYIWNDQSWLRTRKNSNPWKKPASIYEVHLGSWMKKGYNEFLTYNELSETLIPYVKEMGYTHIELLPVLEHPYDGSWGYQVSGYYSATARYGSPSDLMGFIDLCHQAGIGVILDWVPAHFTKDAHGLRFFDGSALYEHLDPKQGENKEWGTMIFNYGRNEVRNFLIANAHFWLEKYHIDGLRIDAVAAMLYLDYSKNDGEWIPNRYGGNENLEAIEFMKQLNTTIHKEFPGALVIAEDSTSFDGVTKPVYQNGLGFGFKWNMGWMNDLLSYYSLDPVYRKYHHGKLTFLLHYAFSENYILPLSHDEVVHLKKSLINKMPGDEWQKFANLRNLFTFMFAFPGKKLHFMGGEFGQWGEWSEERSLDWHLPKTKKMHKKLQECMKELNYLYTTEPALFDDSAASFEWVDFEDSENSIISFIRKSDKETLLFVFNFTPRERYDYRIGINKDGFFKEIFNSDSKQFGGSNLGNGPGIQTYDEQFNGRARSLKMNIPPLGALIFKLETHETVLIDEIMNEIKIHDTTVKVVFHELVFSKMVNKQNKAKIIDLVKKSKNRDVGPILKFISELWENGLLKNENFLKIFSLMFRDVTNINKVDEALKELTEITGLNVHTHLMKTFIDLILKKHTGQLNGDFKAGIMNSLETAA